MCITYRDRKLKVRSPDNSTHVCKVKGSNCAKRYDRQRCDVISSADDAGMKKLMVTAWKTLINGGIRNLKKKKKNGPDMSKYSLFLTSDIYNVDDFSPAPLALYLNGISITCLQALTYIYFIQNDTVWKLMDFLANTGAGRRIKCDAWFLVHKFPKINTTFLHR